MSTTPRGVDDRGTLREVDATLALESLEPDLMQAVMTG